MSKENSNEEKVIETDCYNCKFVANNDESADPKIFNDEGGIDPQYEEEMDRAKQADLITLSGRSKTETKTKKSCYNNNIKMYVTVRMCCAYWEDGSVKRPFIRLKIKK